MKTLRVWLLVLLAALLPIRGAAAAAMLCLPTAEGGSDTVLMAGSGTGHAQVHASAHASHQHESQHEHEHEHDGHLMAQADGDAVGSASGGHHDGGGKCNLCCGFCSMTPMLSTPPSVPAPVHLTSVSFPDLCAPAPSFLSDGQERPPRSI